MYNNGNIDIIIPYNSKQNQLFERLAGFKKIYNIDSDSNDSTFHRNQG